MKDLETAFTILLNPKKKTKMNKEYPQPGQKWQHYKGGQYEIICMCNHTDTNEPLVIYKSLSFGSIYARPFSEWHDVVLKEKHGDIVRFGKL